MVDAGTAVTVDVVTSDGVFRGGAILPGIQTAAAALANATDALPLVEHSDLSVNSGRDRQIDRRGDSQRHRLGMSRSGAGAD